MSATEAEPSPPPTPVSPHSLQMVAGGGYAQRPVCLQEQCFVRGLASAQPHSQERQCLT